MATRRTKRRRTRRFRSVEEKLRIIKEADKRIAKGLQLRVLYEKEGLNRSQVGLWRRQLMEGTLGKPRKRRKKVQDSPSPDPIPTLPPLPGVHEQQWPTDGQVTPKPVMSGDDIVAAVKDMVEERGRLRAALVALRAELKNALRASIIEQPQAQPEPQRRRKKR